MKVGGRHWRSIALADDGRAVEIIDQTLLPHRFETRRLETLEDAAEAIRAMRVRGAPLIGATAAYGLCLALSDDPSDERLETARATLAATRPTAVNLRWALEDMAATLAPLPPGERVAAAYARAAEICDEDIAVCRAIGEHGAGLIREAWERAGKTEPVDVLTHCNAGWLATIDWGTALAAVYVAHDAGVPHTVIVDNAGGHLMQRGRVDLCITGTDRTTASGDVCNKIGTYLKALAAHDNSVPFYVALPHTTIDWSRDSGLEGIPIEERDPSEVTHVTGRTDEGEVVRIRVVPEGSPALNYGFDVTPARLVTGLITERGVCEASRDGLIGLYPEHAGDAK